jgi:hypothetical protein
MKLLSTPIREYEQAVYVYWLGPSLPTVKIGHTNNPARRLEEFRRETGTPGHKSSFAAIVWLDRHRERVELAAHRTAGEFRRDGEWFAMSASDAIDHVVAAAKANGIRYEVEDCAGIWAETIAGREREAADAEILRLEAEAERAAIRATQLARAERIRITFRPKKGYEGAGSHEGSLSLAERLVILKFSHRPFNEQEAAVPKQHLPDLSGDDLIIGYLGLNGLDGGTVFDFHVREEQKQIDERNARIAAAEAARVEAEATRVRTVEQAAASEKNEHRFIVGLGIFYCCVSVVMIVGWKVEPLTVLFLSAPLVTAIVFGGALSLYSTLIGLREGLTKLKAKVF